MQDTLLIEHFPNFYLDLEFLHPRYCKGSKYFSFLYLEVEYNGCCILQSVKYFLLGYFNISLLMLMSSYEEKVACGKILEKMGLKGYLVNEATLFPFKCVNVCLLALSFILSHQGIATNLLHE